MQFLRNTDNNKEKKSVLILLLTWQIYNKVGFNNNQFNKENLTDFC